MMQKVKATNLKGGGDVISIRDHIPIRKHTNRMCRREGEGDAER
jgi:hypothetical protein